jgi:hypothetical protein
LKRRLKVKKRSVLMIVAMLSVFLFGIGTAYAVTGVNDDVPGSGVIIPIICEGTHNTAPTPPSFGTLNTIWAIAERTALSGIICDVTDSVCTPKSPTASAIGVVRTTVNVKDHRSIVRLDSSECWSRNDVISNDCQTLISLMAEDDQAAMEVVLGGVTYFAGYVEYKVPTNGACGSWTGYPETDRFIPWVYLNDLAEGFASGFNGVTLEGGVGPELEERCTDGSCAGDFIGVTARTVFPRFFLLNGDADSFNWWIFLLGRNQNAFGPQAELQRQLTCFICDEGERCFSKNIPLPDEYNIINVSTVLPGGLFTTFPKAGFAYCDIDESGFLPGEADLTTLAGTVSYPCNSGNNDCETYSLWGWAYQRAVPTSVNARVAAIHPIHRLYCQDSDAASELPNRFDTGTVAPCSTSGPTP